jgi:putative transposase
MFVLFCCYKFSRLNEPKTNHSVFFYVRYGVSYRDLEEIMEERGVNVDHVALNRWVIRYAPAIAAKAQSQKRNTNRSWRMDETYIKLKGK